MLYYENENGKLFKGDCLEVMDKLIENGVKVDAIITDPPYQITNSDWDLLIPFNNHIKVKNKRGKEIIMYEQDYIMYMLENTDKSYEYIKDEFMQNSKEGMWDKVNTLIKPNGVIALFGRQPFTTKLINSNISNFKYEWVWIKNRGTGHLNAKIMPLSCHETVSIFCEGKTLYNPQKTKGEPYQRLNCSRDATNKGTYGKMKKTTDTVNKGDRYPKSYLEFPKVERTLHQNQKPVSLIEYLIKTYTNEGELILDFTSGSSTTAVACENTNRKWICIEKEDKYCEISKNRIIKEGNNNAKI